MSGTEIDPHGMVHKKLVVIGLLAFAAGMGMATFIVFAQSELGAGPLEIGFGLLASTLIVVGGAELFDRLGPETVRWSG